MIHKNNIKKEEKSNNKKSNDEKCQTLVVEKNQLSMDIQSFLVIWNWEMEKYSRNENKITSKDV